MSWKLYIDSPLQKSLDLCRGSFTEEDGYGDGWGWIDGDGKGINSPYCHEADTNVGYGDGYCDGYGTSWGNGRGSGWNGWSNGNGRSATEW